MTAPRSIESKDDLNQHAKKFIRAVLMGDEDEKQWKSYVMSGLTDDEKKDNDDVPKDDFQCFAEILKKIKQVIDMKEVEKIRAANEDGIALHSFAELYKAFWEPEEAFPDLNVLYGALNTNAVRKYFVEFILDNIKKELDNAKKKPRNAKMLEDSIKEL